MKHKTKDILGISIALAIVAAAIWFVFLRGPMSEEERAALIEEHKPRLYDAYCQLAALYDFDALAWPSEFRPIPELPDDGAELIGQLSSDGNAQTVLENVVAWERLCARLKRLLGDTGPWWGADLVAYSDPEEWTKEDVALFRTFRAQNAVLFALIQETAARGGPVHPLAFPCSSGDVPLDHLRWIRRCYELLGADFVLRINDGSEEEAARSLAAMFDLDRAMAGEPVLLSQVYRRMGLDDVFDAVQDAFYRGRISPVLGRGLLRDLETVDVRPACAEAQKGAFVAAMLSFEELAAGRIPSRMRRQGENLALPERVMRMLCTNGIVGVVLRRDEQAYVDGYREVERAAQLPLSELRSTVERLDAVWERRLSVRTLCGLELFWHTCEIGAPAHVESRIDIARLGIAVELYYQENGRYPDELRDVESILGTPIPVDTYSDKSYRYEREEDTFMLYGLGSNGEDDDGRRGRDGDDIVWRYGQWRGAATPEASRSEEEIAADRLWIRSVREAGLAAIPGTSKEEREKAEREEAESAKQRAAAGGNRFFRRFR